MDFEPRKRWKSRSLVPSILKNKSASRCFLPKVKPASFEPVYAPVYLNVYDLTPANGYFYWAGLGIYHSGVEGSMCNCILPEALKTSVVKHDPN